MTSAGTRLGSHEVEALWRRPSRQRNPACPERSRRGQREGSLAGHRHETRPLQDRQRHWLGRDSLSLVRRARRAIRAADRASHREAGRAADPRRTLPIGFC